MSSSNLLKGIFCSVAGALFATTAWASDAHVAPMTDYAKSTVKQWISDATVIEAVKAQNAKHAGLSQTDIDNMDKDWRAQTDDRSKPTNTEGGKRDSSVTGKRVSVSGNIGGVG